MQDIFNLQLSILSLIGMVPSGSMKGTQNPNSNISWKNAL